MARKIVYVEPIDYFPKEIRDKYFNNPENKKKTSNESENEEKTTEKPAAKRKTKWGDRYVSAFIIRTRCDMRC